MKRCKAGMLPILSFFLIALFLTLNWKAIAQQASVPHLAEIKAAAESGDPQAQDKLGDAYLSWLDRTNALVWYRKAAEKGVPNSQYHVAQILMGQGYDSIFKKVLSSEKMDEALKWYVIAANNRHQQGQISLAQLYEDGGFIQRDYAEAYKWYSLANRTTGFEVVAKVYLDRLILKMTREQIADGQKRLEKFLSSPNTSVELPEPAFVSKIALKALSGVGSNRLAIINNKTLSAGEEGSIKVDGKAVMVKCLEIQDSSVLVKIEGVEKIKELRLK